MQDGADGNPASLEAERGRLKKGLEPARKPVRKSHNNIWRVGGKLTEMSLGGSSSVKGVLDKIQEETKWWFLNEDISVRELAFFSGYCHRPLK